MDYSLPGSSVHGFSTQEHWSVLPFPPPEDLLEPGIEPMSPSLASGFFTTEPSAKPLTFFLDQMLTVGECSHSHGGSLCHWLHPDPMAGERGRHVLNTVR